MKPFLVAALMCVSIAVFMAWMTGAIPSETQYCTENQQTKHEDCAAYNIGLVALLKTGKFLDNASAAITAIATAIIAAFTFTLWRATTDQGRLTKQALVSSRRAFVFASGLVSQWTPERVAGSPTRYLWNLRVVWQNSGETPTRRLLQSTHCIVRDTPLPDGDPFPESPLPPGSGLIGPKFSNTGGVTPIPLLTPEVLAAVTRGESFIYFGGWVRYRDVFENTPERITRFRWQITILGDPFDFIPGHGSEGPHTLRFDLVHMTTGNCADEECNV